MSVRGSCRGIGLCLLIAGIVPAPANGARLVRVGVYPNLPKVGLSETGQAEGIFVDIIVHVAAAEGWALEFVSGTWGEGLDRLSAGQIDLMTDVAFTAEREAMFAFHREPVLSDMFQVYAPPGSGIRSVLDLNKKRVAVLDRSIQQEAFGKSFFGFDLQVALVPLPDYEQAFAAAQHKEVDAVIVNRFYGSRYARARNLEDTAVLFFPTRLFFAAPKTGDPALLEAIDRHLVDLKQDPASAYYRSLERWTSEEPGFHLATWIKGVGIVAGALLLFSLVWSLSLKHQVAHQTRQLQDRNRENARLYEELQSHARELERRVTDRTDELLYANRELQTAKEAAESADRLKSAFLATMSHELRTPLNSIIGFTGILLQSLAGPLNAEQRKQLEIVRASARHLLELINDVLDISKIEAGQLEVSPAPFDLRATLAKVMAMVRPLAEKKKLVLDLESAPDIDFWTSDVRRVEQILLNLLNNAIKFTEQGSVTLRADLRAGKLSLAVADTGIGIRPEDLVQLFQPFRQIDSGLTRQHDGTGLGLAICRRLARLLGGEILVASQWNQGSVFTLELPEEESRSP